MDADLISRLSCGTGGHKDTNDSESETPHRRAEPTPTGSTSPHTSPIGVPLDRPAASESADEVFERLGRGACERRLRGLIAVHNACKAIAAQASTDFRICTVGLLAKQLDGPSTRSISNSWGKPYRILIKAHSDEAIGRLKRGSNPSLLIRFKETTDPDLLRALIASLEGRCAALQREINRLSYSACVQHAP